MHIEKLEIRGFGKLSGLELKLGKGLNLIYGQNESGKSTLQAFIKAMLYGLKSGRALSGGLPAPLKRFMPWSGGSFGGAVEYRLDNGLFFRMERDFGRNTAEIFDEHFSNITGGYISGRDKNLTIAQKHTGMNEECFERTVFVKQMETSLDGDGLALLSNRLANAGETGFDDISFKKADRALKEALLNHVGTDKTSARPLDRLNARVAELEAAKTVLMAEGTLRMHSRSELKLAGQKRDDLLARKEFLARVRELVELRKLLEGRMAAESEMKDCARHIRELESRLDRIAKETKVPRPAGRTSLLRPADIPAPAALLAASILAMLFGRELSPYIYGAAFLLLAAAAGILLLSVFRGRSRAEENDAGKASHETRLSLAMQLKDRQKEFYSKATLVYGTRIDNLTELAGAVAETAKSISAYEADLAEGLKEVCGSYESKPDDPFDTGKLEEVIYDSSQEWLENTISREAESNDRSLNEAALNIRGLETLLRNDRSDEEALQRIEEEEVSLKEKKSELEKTGTALKLALEVLNEAGSEVRRSLTPALERKMSGIAGRMTGGRYTHLRVDDGLIVNTIAPETGDVRGIRLFSGGTADQLYLALRLALAGVLAPDGENLPVFLDEVFSQYDDIRTGQTLKFLFEEYCDGQVLLFTCKERETAIAGEICGSRLNLLRL